MLSNTTGSNNTAIGYIALYNNMSATNTVAIGYQAGIGDALYSNQGGTVVGYQVGHYFHTGSDYNILLGYNAGYNITTGSNNIWIGTASSSEAIANLTTGSQNILIGNNISLPSATANGQLNIGNIIYGTGITGTGSTLSSGNIGINQTSPAYKLDVSGLGHFTGLVDAQNFVATSSSATSTFAGGITGPNNFTVQQTSGRVGIGTANPVVMLDINGTTHVGGKGLLQVKGVGTHGYISTDTDTPLTKDSGYIWQYGGTAKWYAYIGEGSTDLTFLSESNKTITFQAGGNVGIGETVPGSKLSVKGGMSVGNDTAYSQIAAPTDGMIIKGKLGTATTTPWRTLSVTGTVGFDGLTPGAGAGALCLSANKEVT